MADFQEEDFKRNYDFPPKNLFETKESLETMKPAENRAIFLLLEQLQKHNHILAALQLTMKQFEVSLQSRPNNSQVEEIVNNFMYENKLLSLKEKPSFDGDNSEIPNGLESLREKRVEELEYEMKGKVDFSFFTKEIQQIKELVLLESHSFKQKLLSNLTPRKTEGLDGKQKTASEEGKDGMITMKDSESNPMCENVEEALLMEKNRIVTNFEERVRLIDQRLEMIESFLKGSSEKMSELEQDWKKEFQAYKQKTKEKIKNLSTEMNVKLLSHLADKISRFEWEEIEREFIDRIQREEFEVMHSRWDQKEIRDEEKMKEYDGKIMEMQEMIKEKDASAKSTQEMIWKLKEKVDGLKIITTNIQQNLERQGVINKSVHENYTNLVKKLSAHPACCCSKH